MNEPATAAVPLFWALHALGHSVVFERGRDPAINAAVASLRFRERGSDRVREASIVLSDLQMGAAVSAEQLLLQASRELLEVIPTEWLVIAGRLAAQRRRGEQIASEFHGGPEDGSVRVLPDGEDGGPMRDVLLPQPANPSIAALSDLLQPVMLEVAHYRRTVVDPTTLRWRYEYQG